MKKKHREKYRFQLSSPLLNNINENQTLLFINFSSSDSPSRNSDTKKIMNYGEADKRLFLGHCTFTIKLY